MAAALSSNVPNAGGSAGAGPVGRRGLSRAQRITRSPQFFETYEAGLCRRGRLMNLWVRRQPDGALRLGVVASRRVGGAVQRNRAKRLLREAWRLNRDRFRGPVDVILSARSDLVSARYEEVARELLALAARAGLLAPKERI